MESRFGELDFIVDREEISQRAMVLSDRIERVIDEFIAEVGEDIMNPSEESLAAIGLSIDYVNSNHWAGVMEWYGFPPTCGAQVFEVLTGKVYDGSNQAMQLYADKYIRDSN